MTDEELEKRRKRLLNRSRFLGNEPAHVPWRSMGGGGGNVYNPLINYTWATHVSSDYITDGVELFQLATEFIDGANIIALNGSGFTVSTDGLFASMARPKLTLPTTQGEFYTLVISDVNTTSGQNIYSIYDGASYIVGTGFVGEVLEPFEITIEAKGTEVQFNLGGQQAGESTVVASFQKVIQKPNTMYLKDSGTNPKYPAEMKSGKGVKFNGVDQSVTIPNLAATAMIYTKNGVATYTETPFYTLNGNFTFKDVYIFNDTLTPTEISKYSTDPNGFFQDVQDGVIDNCVLNMPLDGTDEYVRDYANYSEVEINDGVNAWFLQTNWTYSNDILTSTGGNTDAQAKITNKFSNGEIGIISFDIELTDGILIVYSIGSSYVPFPYVTANGSYSFINQFDADLSEFSFYSNTFTGSISNISIKKLSGVHEIANYTTSARDTTSTLNYGTQELNFTRDGLWRGDLSSYLECNNSLVKTGYRISHNISQQIEYIISERSGDTSAYGNILYADNGTCLYSRINTGTVNRLGTNMNSFGYTEITLNGLTHIVLDMTPSGYTLYHNGVSQGLKNSVGGGYSEILNIGATQSLLQPYKGQMRLFKVHTEPQDPLELYSNAVAKGLLT